MQTFAVISAQPNEAVSKAVQDIYKDAFQAVASNVWLVADRGVTPAEVCSKLGVRHANAPGLEGVVVVHFGAYYGHASRLIWDWIAAKTVEA